LIRAVVLPFLLLFAAASGCEDGLKPALAALQRNDAAGAVSLLESVRTQCGGSSSFYDLLGIANEFSGNAPAAEDALREAVSLDPKSSRLFADLGATYLRNNKPKDAAAALSQALALDPANSSAATYLIGAYVASGEWQKAADLFDRPGIAAGQNLLKDQLVALWFAQTFIALHQPVRIDRALSPEVPNMAPGLLFSLGTLLAKNGLYDRAIKYLQKIPADKADDAVVFNLGLVSSHLQKFEQARAYYFQAIDLKPENVEAYFHVGLDYAAAGDQRKAIPWLVHARDSAPARADIAYALAEQLIQLQYFISAKDVLNRALEANARNPLLLAAMGDEQFAEGDATAALRSYNKALEESPKMPPALVGSARVDISQGKGDEGRRLLQEAITADPNDRAALGELGILEAQEQQWGPAFEHLNRAWSQNRSNVEVALQLGRTLQHLNRADEAVQLLLSLPREAQRSPAFHLELAQLYSGLHRTSEAEAERAAIEKTQAQKSDSIRFDNPQTYVY
jgi:tetratricopeptide (TPR) repeat protein